MARQIDDIQEKKNKLIEDSKKGLNNSITEYNALIQSEADRMNAGALNSYNAYTNPQGTQKQATGALNASNSGTARGAYLNRLRAADKTAADIGADLQTAGNYYRAYADAADANADANIAALRYNDAVNAEKMAYEDERNAVNDARWAREYEATKNAYAQAARAARSSGGGYYGGYEITGSPEKGGSGGHAANGRMTGTGTDPARLKILQEQAEALGANADTAKILSQARAAGASQSVIWDLMGKMGLR